MKNVLRFLLIFFLVARANTMLLAGQPADSPPSSNAVEQFNRVVDLEQEGRLTEAFQLFQQTDLARQHTNHAEKLRVALRILAFASSLKDRTNYAAARSALDDLRLKLESSSAEAGLVMALRSKMAEVDVAARATAEAEAKRMLSKADALLALDDYKQAGIIYQHVAEQKDPPISSSLLIEAKTGKKKADVREEMEKAAGSWSQQWTSVSSGLRTIFLWAVCVGVPAAILWLVAASKRWWGFRKGVRLTVLDLTASSADRDTRSQQLSREISLRLGALGDPTGDGADLDASNDLDGTDLPNIIIDQPTPVDLLPLDTTPMRLGGLSFSPAQLWAMLRELFRRPCEHDLAGSLINSGRGALIAVDHLSKRGLLSGKRWQSDAEGDDARAKVVRDMTLRLALAIGAPATTENWGSFRSYHEARSEIAAARGSSDRKTALEKSMASLQDSIRYDPSNWLSWFYLATVLRKLGQNRRAADHFAFLEELVANPPARLMEFVVKHPEFPLIVRYNRAVCLSKLDDWNSHRKAVDMLRQLILQVSQADSESTQMVNEKRELDPSEKKRLQMLFRSALASALVFELEQHRAEERDRHDPDKSAGNTHEERQRAREESIFAEIVEQCNLIEKLGDNDDPSDDRAYTLARSVGQNARGRALYCLGKFGDAMTALGRAITLMPDFIDPYLNQASIYLKRKEQISPAWTKEAEDNLSQALSLSPSNQKAHFLMGRLYGQPAVGKYEQAREHFVKADLFAWSYFFHAQILVQQENNLKDAVDQLRRSIALNADPDFRFIYYVHCILEITKPRASVPGAVAEPPIDRSAINLLRAAERAAELLNKKGVKDGAELLAKVKARLQDLNLPREIPQDESAPEHIP